MYPQVLCFTCGGLLFLWHLERIQVLILVEVVQADLTPHVAERQVSA